MNKIKQFFKWLFSEDDNAVIARASKALQIETKSSEIRRLIGMCKTLEQSYHVRSMIRNFMYMYRDDKQAARAVESLTIDLNRRDAEIIAKL